MLDVVNERKANNKEGLSEGSAEVFFDADSSRRLARFPGSTLS